MIRNGVFRPHVKETINGGKRLPTLGIKDVMDLVRERSGIRIVATGERMDDSLPRRGQLHKCSGFDEERGRLFPVWDWSAKDVIGYLRARKIPIPTGFGRRDMNGLDLRADTLAFLKEHHPDDYQIVLDAFPFAESQLKRREFLAARNAALTSDPVDG